MAKPKEEKTTKSKKEEKEKVTKPEKEELKKEEPKKSCKKGIITAGIIIILAIVALIIWWFNRKFDVVIKYNNGEKDQNITVKYLKKIDKKDINFEVKMEEHSLIGFYETYELNKEDKQVCKEKFTLNDEKNKCIAEDEFDFDNTQIKENKTIEAIWSTILFKINPTVKTINEGEKFNIAVTISGTKDTSVKWSSENSSIASVNAEGKVTGNKKGTTNIIAESNGIKRKCRVTVKEIKKEEPKEEPVKDNGTISLSASNKCVVKEQRATITATVNNALDNTVNWKVDGCLTKAGEGNSITVIPKTCGSTASITGSLNNGQSSSLTLTIEDALVVTVLDNGDNKPDSEGYYHGVKSIKTNIPVTMTSNGSIVYGDPKSPTTSVIGNAGADGVVTIKTPCGQTKTIKWKAVIN